MSGVSLDSNILSAVWNRESTAQGLSQLMNELASRHRLIICGPVYAELHAEYGDISEAIKPFTLMPEMSLEVWQRAGSAHGQYKRRRKRSGGGLPRQILSDYLIGAQASVHDLHLLTLNVDDYREFPEVPLLTL